MTNGLDGKDQYIAKTGEVYYNKASNKGEQMMSLDRRALELEMQQAGRLPPGQSLTLKFPVLHYGGIPAMNLETWQLHIWGLVNKEVSVSWKEIARLPKVNITMDLHCVTKWSKFDTLWEGLYLRTLLDELSVQVDPKARFVVQHAPQGFSTNLPLEAALGENFLLATGYAGEPLTPEHGYPMRGVIGAIPGRRDLPDVYLWKGAKWLTGLEFLAEDRLGFWEEAGYHNEGNVWQEQRIS
jgi:DMSO/TMAO reductase YedYZ molybdopterin-dependent catalytic subunit